MARKVARIGDKTRGVCRIDGFQSGKIIQGSNDVLTNNRRTARVGDRVRANCGHIGVIVSGSNTVRSNFKKNAAIGDRTTGIYKATIVSGSPNTYTQ